MQIKIVPRQHGGTEFLAQPQRLHLGAQNAAGVDQLEFLLPECWKGCSTALYLRRSDGTLLAPIPLDEQARVMVDHRLTGCTGGQWMLSAVKGDSYTAYTRPGSYDVYTTLPTDGGSEELSPSLYEQFVARVLESASTAATAAQKAAANAKQTDADAAAVQIAVQKILDDRTNAADCATRAEAAAARAEKVVSESGAVSSVNGKGGAVQLDAADVHAVPRPALPVSGELLRVLSVDPDDGTLITDTTPPPDLSPYLRRDALPDAQTVGGVRADPQYGISVRSDGTMTLVPASAEQLDSMTDAYAPITPAQLPYGIKKALTRAASWSIPEQTAAQKSLGVPDSYYTKEQADARFGAPYTLPAATASMLGGIKVGAGLNVTADGVLSATSISPLYRITYEGYYDGTNYSGYDYSPVEINLSRTYDYIFIAQYDSSYTEEQMRYYAFMRLLRQFTTIEFKSVIHMRWLANYGSWISGTGSSEGGGITRAHLNGGTNSKVRTRVVGNTIQIYYTSSGGYNDVLNSSTYRYFIFGVDDLTGFTR